MQSSAPHLLTGLPGNEAFASSPQGLHYAMLASQSFLGNDVAACRRLIGRGCWPPPGPEHRSFG